MNTHGLRKYRALVFLYVLTIEIHNNTYDNVTLNLRNSNAVLSYFSAFENDEPIYIIKGERRYDPEDGERIAYDMINPEENNHLHYDRINGETNEFEEPLDSFEIDESDDYDGDEDYDDDRIESE